MDLSMRQQGQQYQILIPAEIHLPDNSPSIAD